MAAVNNDGLRLHPVPDSTTGTAPFVAVSFVRHIISTLSYVILRCTKLRFRQCWYVRREAVFIFPTDLPRQQNRIAVDERHKIDGQ
jgi:hypothetical protein